MSAVSVPAPAVVFCEIWEVWLRSPLTQTQLCTGLRVSLLSKQILRFVGANVSACASISFRACAYCHWQAERSVTPITALKAINRDPTHFMCPKRPKKTEAGYKQPALLNCSRLNSIKMCGSEDVIQYVAQYSQSSSPPSLAPQDNKRLNKYVK